MNTSMKQLGAVFEKIVTLLSVLAILAYMGTFAALLSLDMIVGNTTVMAPVILGLLLLGCLLQKSSKAIHRRRIPMILYVLCAIVLVFTLFLSPSEIATYVFSGLLVVVSGWNLMLERRFSKSKVKTIKV